MKKFFAFTLLFSLLAVPGFAKIPDKDIIIIYTNDVHCGFDDNVGYAGVEFYKHEMKKLTPYVTLVDAGDFVQGATIGTISNGRYIIEIMNAMNYDLAVPGNHEFDYGWSQFENFVKNLKCGFVACNLRDSKTGELLFKPYRIFTYGETKIAFVGACTPETLTKSIPSTFKDEEGNYIYDFDGDFTGEKICASIQKAVDDARSEGADYVIVLGHLGEYGDATEVWSAPFIAARTRNIDAFIDAHSHEITPALMIKNLDGKEIPITQGGTKLIRFGKVTINTEGKLTTELIEKVDGKDEKIESLIADIKARYEDSTKKKLTYSDFELRAMDDEKQWLVRNGETGLCNLIADAFLDSTFDRTNKAEIAFVNAGAMRTNLNSGDITFNDALSVLPFANTMCIAEVSGQTILDELEMGARLMPEKSGGFLHVSGMTYEIDTKIPTPVKLDDKNRMIGISGARRIKNAKVNGEPLDPKRIYKIAAANFVLFEGGDGHVFEGLKMLDKNYAVIADVLAAYLRKFDKLPERYRNAEGRITIIK